VQRKTDSDLVVQARRGDKQAFNELLDRYQQMAMRVAQAMVKQEEVARDLVQEAFLAAYLSLEQLKDESRFKNWLYSIILNVCRRYLRDQKTTLFSLEALLGGVPSALLELPGADLDPQDVVEAHELHEIILHAVRHLSPRECITTLLFYYEQLSIHEIATFLEISESAVKSRLFQARKQLRASLLPLNEYVYQFSQKQRRREAMIPMNIEGVRRSVWRSDQCLITLIDEAGRQLLNISIGQQEAYVIVMALHHFAFMRPTTLHFMANALKATHVTLEEVRIEGLHLSPFPVFVATTCLRNGDSVQEVDARPSDALGLAALLNSPIRVSADLLKAKLLDQRVGVILPEGKTSEEHYAEMVLHHEGIVLPEGKELRLGPSKVPARQALAREVKASLLGVPQLPTEQAFEQAKKDYLRYILGDDFEQYKRKG
jgi:RNA polymerase sigma-70 factor (ECF subfamily)